MQGDLSLHNYVLTTEETHKVLVTHRVAARGLVDALSVLVDNSPVGEQADREVVSIAVDGLIRASCDGTPVPNHVVSSANNVIAMDGGDSDKSVIPERFQYDLLIPLRLSKYGKPIDPHELTVKLEASLHDGWDEGRYPFDVEMLLEAARLLVRHCVDNDDFDLRLNAAVRVSCVLAEKTE